MKKKEKHRETWDVGELEVFFRDNKIPSAPVILSGCEKIVDVKLFIESHLRVIRKNNGNPTFLPYYERLLMLKYIITEL